MTDTPAPDIAPDPYYAPNQQVVRPDGSGPAEEGEGGSSWDDPTPKSTVDLDSMTKDQLLTYAANIGAPASSAMTKADLIAGIQAKGG